MAGHQAGMTALVGLTLGIIVTWSGPPHPKSTNLGYLKEANAANSSPIWGVRAQVSGFVNQADTGSAWFVLINTCSGQAKVPGRSHL
ncbi:hypothetical protein [Nonomuraea typhae]|uniref:Uncharacterized protein n=1 Tax=Nonomuraea typhae TaxID=2603600 RepID=A0ABW7YPJ4_9ACTN